VDVLDVLIFLQVLADVDWSRRLGRIDLGADFGELSRRAFAMKV
jgi:hypothetical protein